LQRARSSELPHNKTAITPDYPEKEFQLGAKSKEKLFARSSNVSKYNSSSELVDLTREADDIEKILKEWKENIDNFYEKNKAIAFVEGLDRSDELGYVMLKPEVRGAILLARNKINVQCEKDFTCTELMYSPGIDAFFVEFIRITIDAPAANVLKKRKRGSSYDSDYNVYINTWPSRYILERADADLHDAIIFFSRVERRNGKLVQNINSDLTEDTITNSSRRKRPQDKYNYDSKRLRRSFGSTTVLRNANRNFSVSDKIAGFF